MLGRVQLFAEAFAGMRATVCYSVKANSNLSILRLLAAAGAGFDIVSGGELERVRQAAKSSLRRVVFSGVGKTAAEIDAALAARILVFNVESPAELELLEQRARHLRKRAPVAMRVNPDVFAATHPYISTGMTEHKFGVAIADAAALYQRAARSSYLAPTGVSVHIGSQIRSAEPFGQALQRVVQLVRELKSPRTESRFGISMQAAVWAFPIRARTPWKTERARPTPSLRSQSRCVGVCEAYARRAGWI